MIICEHGSRSAGAVVPSASSSSTMSIIPERCSILVECRVPTTLVLPGKHGIVAFVHDPVVCHLIDLRPEWSRFYRTVYASLIDIECAEK
ncbi:hypothetical protein FHS98_002569 [Sphingomonas oligoaromativorans]|nr:hypothetical protein [Sphingomonas oligoaromativorans]